MYSFRNDYTELAHPRILEALARCNYDQTPGYGLDDTCKAAEAQIRRIFDCPQADVHFIAGGTLANLTAIAAFLKDWESVIAPSSGHISIHEAGAVEACGHKVCEVEAPDGKLTPALLEQVCRRHEYGQNDFIVVPRLVYISDATEWGTVYSRQELYALHEACRKLNLYLYMDGARLAQALTAAGNDVTPEDVAACCDAFYIGGTKNGLLLGEALVIVREELKPQFRYSLKQHGAMLAKGRIFGAQFTEYFTDGLWLELARRSVESAQRVREAFRKKGYSFYVESPTNQIFVLVSGEQLHRLEQDFIFEVFARPDEDHAVIRFATSWATTEEAVQAAERLI